ncbi:MAG: acetamidase/formamidase family protein, partial [Myxococcota bacterium]|nr:acetamidase/formamidase family protein [Myxococcota bacterium]
MQQVKGRPGEYAYVIGPYAEPIATVRPGESFVVGTADAFENRVDSPDADITKIIELPYVNPLTGPVYVEGAEKGDTLAVTIHSIEVARDYGVSALIPEFGGLCSTVFTRTLNEPLPPRVMLHPIRDGEITFSEELPIATISVTPFYGTMGTAPELEAISSLAPGAHGGNMDAADVKPGNTIFLPVHVPGAFLYVGDGHAAQGDAEVCGVAVEVPTRGTLSVELIKGASVRTPRVDSPEHIMTIGSARPMED